MEINGKIIDEIEANMSVVNRRLSYEVNIFREVSLLSLPESYYEIMGQYLVALKINVKSI